jgi:DNA helicase-2/ATP-dependent DNA helicase PcrA
MGQRAAAVLQRLFGSAGAPGLMAKPPWARTFHDIGACLLREYAGTMGLEASFTINDRRDSEDLMGMVRQEIGLSTTTGRAARNAFR